MIITSNYTLQSNDNERDNLPNSAETQVDKHNKPNEEIIQIFILKWMILFVQDYFIGGMFKICKNIGLSPPLFSRIRTASTILSLYVKIRVTENPHFWIFYAVGEKFVLEFENDKIQVKIRYLVKGFEEKCSI